MRQLPMSTLFPYTTLFRSISDRKTCVQVRISEEAIWELLKKCPKRKELGAVEIEKLKPRAARPMSHRYLLTEYGPRSEEHTSELQSLTNLVCRLLLEKKRK